MSLKRYIRKTSLFSILLLTLLSGRLFGQIQPQENSMWCWASCVQSVLAQANVNQTQSEIVARLTGVPQNRPAHVREVVQLLQSYRFRAWEVNHPASPEQLYNTLANGWKLIALVNPSNDPSVGHFIILQGLSPEGMVIVSDPADGRTYLQAPQQLYQHWRWNYSVVVGTPVNELVSYN